MAEQADRAGVLLSRLSTVPGLVLAAFLAVAFLTVLGDAFRPLPVLGIGAFTAAALIWWTRSVPPLFRRPTPWWVLWSVLAIAVASGVTNALTHSEQILVQRDPASYVQFGWWLSEHEGLPVDQHREAFGGGVPGMSWNGPAFYQVGTAVWPQFMIGMPTVLGAVEWAAGLDGMLVTSAVLGALALLSFAGLAARLLGPRWAPFATLLLAGCFPQMYVSRSAYSEPLAQLLLLAGLCLLVDCRRLRGSASLFAAGGAGLLLGIGELVRIDVLRDLIPVLLLVGVFAARRYPYALPLGGFLLGGFALGALDGVLLSRPYVESLRGSLVPLVAVALLVVVGATGYGVLGRLGRLGPLAPERVVGRRRLPTVAGAVVAAGFVAFATRPLWQTVRGAAGPTREYIGDQQRAQGLPPDPSRWYYEWSLHWVSWWLGWAAVAFAALAAVLLTVRLLRGQSSRWLPVLPVLLWSTAATLWLPSITPDHPWADRRLVPVVLPAVVLLSCYGLRWCLRRVAERRPGGIARFATVAGVASLVLPLGIATGPLVYGATHRGERAALATLCAEIGPDASVVGVDRATNVYMQALRGMCGIPVARFYHPTERRVADAAAAIRASGRRPVFLGGNGEELARLTGATPVHVVDLHTRQEQHLFTERPVSTTAKSLTCWVAFPDT